MGRLTQRSSAALGVAAAVVIGLGTDGSRARTPAAGSGGASTGGLLAFESNDRRTQIVAVRPDGTGLRVLRRSAREPVWSPDGRWLAYTREPVVRGLPAIMRARADGSGARRVSRFATDGRFNPAYPSYASWSPDGRRLVFSARYEQRDANGEIPVSEEGEALVEAGVFVSSARGSKPRRLRAKTGEGGPAFSPDGRRIALTTADGRIGIMPATGGPLRVLPRVTSARSRLAFSPDGKRLLVLAGFAPGSISTLDVRSGRRTKLTPAAGELIAAATWAPDGKRIAYMAHLGWTRDGGLPAGWSTALFTVRPDGSRKRRVLTMPTYVQGDSLSWQPAVARR